MFLTYTVFGWYISRSSISWSHWLSEQGDSWGWLLKEDVVFVMLHILAALAILGITVALTAPVAVISVFFGSWLKSDVKAMMSVLGWSFAVVVMMCWLEYSVRFLVLLSAAVLARFELREAGYNNWQLLAILTIIGVGGFGTGALMFIHSH
jgi:hypothetical protein